MALDRNGGATGTGESGTETSIALAAHIASSSAAHAASAINVVDAGALITSNNVEGALAELASDSDTIAAGLAAHLADTADAHAASAITNTPTGTVAATTVQGAINELATDAAALVSDTAYAGSWDGVTTIAPSKNAVYDEIELRAPKASPTLTGTPLSTTAANNTDTTQIATTAFVQAKSRVAPTVQNFTSGSGTYTTPANVKYIEVLMVGSGGGGGGSGSAGGTAAGAGNSSTFGSSLLTAPGGGAGAYGNSGGAGGTTPTINSPAIGHGVVGSDGQSASATGTAAVGLAGGAGGAAAHFSGGGRGGYQGAAGSNGATNTGGGGGGGGCSGIAAHQTGSGGGAGAFISARIVSPSATYAYAVGGAGTAGGAGTSGFAGGAGAVGRIVVIEYY